jgi:hypothetical protein
MFHLGRDMKPTTSRTAPRSTSWSEGRPSSTKHTVAPPPYARPWMMPSLAAVKNPLRSSQSTHPVASPTSSPDSLGLTVNASSTMPLTMVRMSCSLRNRSTCSRVSPADMSCQSLGEPHPGAGPQPPGPQSVRSAGDLPAPPPLSIRAATPAASTCCPMPPHATLAAVLVTRPRAAS